MNKIIYPLKLRMQGPEVSDLQAALQLLLDRVVILRDDEGTGRELSTALQRESADRAYGRVTAKLVSLFQDERRLDATGNVDETTAEALNALLDEWGFLDDELPPVGQPEFEVKGTVSLTDGYPAAGVVVSAFDRDLRSEEPLGQSQKTDDQGFYRIQYNIAQFRKREKGSADLVIKAFAADGSLLTASPVLFNAPPAAEVDLIIPAEAQLPPTLFEKIDRALKPLIDGLRVVELEEDEEHQDVSFLSGEAGFTKTDIARFSLAYKLAAQAIQPEFWFVLLGGSFYQFTDDFFRLLY